MKTLALLFIYFGVPFFGDVKGDDLDRSEATHQQLIANAEYLSSDEKAMLWEINLVRTEPSSYIPFIEEELARVYQDSVRLSGITSESIRRKVSTLNGVEVIETDTTYRNYYQDRVRAIQELLLELSSSIPLPGLRPSRPLYSVALNHGSSQAENNYIDHVGVDGSWPQDRILRASAQWTDGNENIARGVGSPREMVIQLLIDSGVDHRGHRKNILNPDWKYVTCHHVRQLDEQAVRWWIQEFAF